MATSLGWLAKASAQVTRLMTSNGEAISGAISFVASHGEALGHWLKRSTTSHGEAIAGAISFVALVHWLKRSSTSHGEALVHWIQRSSTGATRFCTSACDAIRHWLTISTDDVVVVAEMEVENLGTEQVPMNLPKINTKHDLVVFDYIGQ